MASRGVCDFKMGGKAKFKLHSSTKYKNSYLLSTQLLVCLVQNEPLSGRPAHGKRYNENNEQNVDFLSPFVQLLLLRRVFAHHFHDFSLRELANDETVADEHDEYRYEK
jgi:hypothetical protein